MINYFNYKKIRDQYLLTNDLGRYIFLDSDEFKSFLQTSHVENPKIENRLRKNAFNYSGSRKAFVDEFHHHMLNAKSYLFQATPLQIFVVTNQCNLQCVYCQAQNTDSTVYGKMSKEVAKRAVDIALQAPAKNMQFEFQGGEPLLNFDVIKYIVEYSKNHSENKNINYSVVTNLTLLTDEMLDYFKENNIGISTSLDGNAFIHDLNRPYRNGSGSFLEVSKKIQDLKKQNLYVGALLTATKNSLSYAKEIVDTYLNLGFDQIILRALAPLGCAKEEWSEIGYSPEAFLEFYKEAFEYILQINLKGTRLVEGMAAIFLKKIIEGIPVNYMELRSPCGASVGQMAYYHDGNIYTCDEGRMVAEMGNSSFRLGNVFEDDYNSIMDSKTCKATCNASILEALPSCSDCVYQPYCGVCPVVNYSLYGDMIEKTAHNYRCKIYKGIQDIIFEKLLEDDYEVRTIFRDWIS